MITLWDVTLLLLIGAACGAGAIILGVWIGFRAKSRTDSDALFTSPKGDVFSLKDDVDKAMGFPAGSEEPSNEEKNVLSRTQKFLDVLGGSKE
jgi:hypothetical protein